jgi:Kef-type K+ transport system membrane component KefB
MQLSTQRNLPHRAGQAPVSELKFLPDFPPTFGNIVVVALILLAGLACGELFRRVLLLPRISGYAVAGLVAGPGSAGLLDLKMLEDARLLFDIALGLILFELGSRLDLHWVRRNRWLLASSVAEIVLSFGLVLVVLLLLHVPVLQAAIAGAIGAASGAPVLLLMIHAQRADGPLTDRAINHTALNNVFAVVAVTMLLSFLHLEYRAAAYLVVLHPLYLLLGSMALGYLFSLVLVWLARWLGKREDLQFILLVAMVLLTIGVAKALELSMLIALLALGVMARHRDARRDLLPVEFGPTAQALFVILFVMTGAAVTLGDLAAGAFLGLAYAAARIAGKVLGVVCFAQLSGLRPRKAILLGLTLAPMSALAVVLVENTAHYYPEFGQSLAAVVLSAVMMLELAAPLLAQFALRAAGESHPEAPWT